jgi:predicted nucleic acid-binding protein
VSLRDEQAFNLIVARGHRQVTDVYLLGLAKRHGRRLATFDRTIPIAAVPGGVADDLIIVSE